MYRFTYRLPHQPFPAPSRNEDAYAIRREIQERLARAERRREARAREEREREKALHRDRCPECGTALERARVQEGEVRRCPSCRGAFMDAEMFQRLTHPLEDRSYLTGLLRSFMLEWTTGAIPRETAPRS